MAKPRQGVGVSALAELLGVTTRQVTNYRAEGMPHRVRNGKAEYIPRECVRWLLEREREKAKADADEPKATARDRILLADAELKELELEERRGQLVPIEEFQERIDAVIGGFVAVAAGQLTRFERDIVQTETAGQARRLTERIQDALMEGARAYADELDHEADELEASAAESAA